VAQRPASDRPADLLPTQPDLSPAHQPDTSAASKVPDSNNDLAAAGGLT
jgi:hypothetical protein